MSNSSVVSLSLKLSEHGHHFPSLKVRGPRSMDQGVYDLTSGLNQRLKRGLSSGCSTFLLPRMVSLQMI